MNFFKIFKGSLRQKTTNSFLTACEGAMNYTDQEPLLTVVEEEIEQQDERDDMNSKSMSWEIQPGQNLRLAADILQLPGTVSLKKGEVVTFLSCDGEWATLRRGQAQFRMHAIMVQKNFNTVKDFEK
jgi:hypothetical protein